MRTYHVAFMGPSGVITLDVPQGTDPVQFSQNHCQRTGRSTWIVEQEAFAERLRALRGTVSRGPPVCA